MMFNKYQRYACRWCLLVYPRVDMTSWSAWPSASGTGAQPSPAVPGGTGATSHARSFEASYWSKRLKCEVKALASDEAFICLETTDKKADNPVKILSETGIIGYVAPFDWLEFRSLE